MGYGLKFLQASSEENTKAGIAEVGKMEDAPAQERDGAETPAPQRPNPFAPKPAAAASESHSPQGASAPVRPSFSPVARPQDAASAPVRRPSFGSSPPNVTPVASEQNLRPSFGGGSSLPSARGVFVKTAQQFGAAPSGAQSSSAALSPQALFEIVCSHRHMSSAAIEAAKAQAQEKPEVVLAQMRRIYDQEIAPSRMKHASDLPKAREDNPDKVVFLLRKDEKERLRVMPREAALQSGEILLDGATVENIPAAASPFPVPKELFHEEAPETAAAEVQAPVETVNRSPKP